MNKCLSCKYMYIDENIARYSVLIGRGSSKTSTYFDNLVKCNKLNCCVGWKILYDCEVGCNSYERDENV